MKQLVCEMCGGTDLVKSEGVFVCQTCGCKYSVEEAKKMMVEGTVDVKGTVQLDRSSEVDNILKNADTTFGDGNYKEAFDLYSQAMNIDPDNAHAVLYRAISSAWQSTVKDCRIVEINKAGERAFKLKHDQVGDSKEYFTFANDALSQVSGLINAISNMYIRYHNQARPKNFTITGAIATSGISAQVKQTMENGVSNCCVVSSNFPTFILNPVSDYSESFDSLWNSMEIMIKNAGTYRSNARMSHDNGLDRKLEEIQRLRKTAKEQADKYAAEKREKEKQEQLERNEAYWAEHASEKAELEAEKAGLESQLASMKAQYDEIMRQRNEGVDELRKQRDKKTPEEEASDKQQDLIRDLERQRSSLGMFKGKEKKELQARIDQEQVKLEDMRKTAQAAKEQHQAAINEQIKEAQHVGQDVIDEHAKITARISEITTELTKNR